MVKFLILNGPNINIMGRRMPEIYGVRTLDDINQELAEKARPLAWKSASSSPTLRAT